MSWAAGAQRGALRGGPTACAEPEKEDEPVVEGLPVTLGLAEVEPVALGELVAEALIDGLPEVVPEDVTLGVLVESRRPSKKS